MPDSDLKIQKSLKLILDKFYAAYDFDARLHHDPIKFPHRYSDPDDIETAGFIAASFAYGKVDLFIPVIEKILAPGGRHPSDFFRSFAVKRHSKVFRGIRYRFNKEEDIIGFIYILGTALKKNGSLRSIFYQYYRKDDKDIRTALSAFTDHMLSIDTSPVFGKNIKPYGLRQLLPSPRSGSACKRLNLFLRWMVRSRDIDFGIWDRIPPSKLIIPLDTHIARISRCLRLTRRKSSDWKTAREITDALKCLDPSDPLKYDFALCHHGISGMCKGEKFSKFCSSCALSGIT